MVVGYLRQRAKSAEGKMNVCFTKVFLVSGKEGNRNKPWGFHKRIVLE